MCHCRLVLVPVLSVHTPDMAVLQISLVKANLHLHTLYHMVYHLYYVGIPEGVLLWFIELNQICLLHLKATLTTLRHHESHSCTADLL